MLSYLSKTTEIIKNTETFDCSHLLLWLTYAILCKLKDWYFGLDHIPKQGGRKCCSKVALLQGTNVCEGGTKKKEERKQEEVRRKERKREYEIGREMKREEEREED